jgi:hypothetical protein
VLWYGTKQLRNAPTPAATTIRLRPQMISPRRRAPMASRRLAEAGRCDRLEITLKRLDIAVAPFSEPTFLR